MSGISTFKLENKQAADEFLDALFAGGQGVTPNLLKEHADQKISDPELATYFIEEGTRRIG